MSEAVSRSAIQDSEFAILFGVQQMTERPFFLKARCHSCDNDPPKDRPIGRRPYIH
jgi:hypothetical protein